MQKISIMLVILSLLASNTWEVDFGGGQGIQSWYPVLDGVMGGLSKGKLTFEEDRMVFKGEVSLENNGGFASIKSPFGAMDLSKFKQVELRYKLTGHDFAFTFERDRRFYMPNYKLILPNESPGDWQTVTLDLSNANTYRMGRQTGNKPSQAEWASIIRIGFMSYGKSAGPYLLEVDYVKFL
ncbi:MAG: CIA30 family protein [Bacteroidota bacterium]